MHGDGSFIFVAETGLHAIKSKDKDFIEQKIVGKHNSITHFIHLPAPNLISFKF